MLPCPRADCRPDWLPGQHVLAAEIVEDLLPALDQSAKFAEELGARE